MHAIRSCLVTLGKGLALCSGLGIGMPSFGGSQGRQSRFMRNACRWAVIILRRSMSPLHVCELQCFVTRRLLWGAVRQEQDPYLMRLLQSKSNVGGRAPLHPSRNSITSDGSKPAASLEAFRRIVGNMPPGLRKSASLVRMLQADPFNLTNSWHVSRLLSVEWMICIFSHQLISD